MAAAAAAAAASPTRLPAHPQTTSSSGSTQWGTISQGYQGYPPSSTSNSYGQRHGQIYDQQAAYNTSAATNDHFFGQGLKGGLPSAVQLRWQAIQTGKPWDLTDPTGDEEDDDEDDNDTTEETLIHHRRRLSSAIKHWYRFKVTHSKMRLTVCSVRLLHERCLARHMFSQVSLTHTLTHSLARSLSYLYSY